MGGGQRAPRAARRAGPPGAAPGSGSPGPARPAPRRPASGPPVVPGRRRRCPAGRGQAAAGAARRAASASVRAELAALRASASAIPGPSASSSAGSAWCRTRTRAYEGSRLCGSSQGSSRCARQASRRVARRQRRATGGGSGRGGRACPPGPARQSRGPARAARSRPGRPGCGRAAPPRPRSAAPPVPARCTGRCAPRLPGRRPRAASHGHPGLPHRVEPEGEQGRHDPGRLGRRAFLQPVVHGHAAAAQPQPGCLMGQRGRQGQRIRAPRAGGQHQVPGLQVAEAAPDAGPRLGYRGVRAHGRSAARGQRASAAHPVEPQLRVGRTRPWSAGSAATSTPC